MVVDCRSSTQFCKTFEQHRIMAKSSAPLDHRAAHRKRTRPLNPISLPFCEHSPFAAFDIVVLLLALGALGVLTVPYFNIILREACELLPLILDVVRDAISHAPIASATGFLLTFVAAIAAWQMFDCRSRRCGNPYCKGLCKGVEFDIQLESEEMMKYLLTAPGEALGSRPLDLGLDHRKLEAELKKTALPNGRTVLISRAPCGCPSGRMEVCLPKKAGRIKK